MKLMEARGLDSSHQVMDALPGDLVVALGLVSSLSLNCQQEADHLLDQWVMLDISGGNPDRPRLWKKQNPIVRRGSGSFQIPSKGLHHCTRIGWAISAVGQCREIGCLEHL